MPKILPNESRDEFLNRCVPALIQEGNSQDQAVAICGRMYDESQKKSKIELLNDMRKLIDKNGYTISDEKLLGLFNIMKNKELTKKVLFKLKSNFDKTLTKEEALQRIFEIQIFPERKCFFEKYKETIDFNKNLFLDIINNFKNEKLFKPFGDEQHELGKKFFDIKELYHKEGQGLFAGINLTAKGYELIKNRDYSYISPEWGDRIDLDRKKHKNVLWAVTLTNIPAFEGELPTLQEQIKLSKGGSMDINEIKIKLEKLESQINLQDEGAPEEGTPSGEPIDPAKVQELMAMVQELLAKFQELMGAKEEVEEMAAKYMEKTTELEKKLNNEEKEKFFEEIVRLGKLEPFEIEDWEKLYDSNKDFVTKMLQKRPENQSKKLTASSNENWGLSKEDLDVAEHEGIDLNDPVKRKEFIKLMKEE